MDIGSGFNKLQDIFTARLAETTLWEFMLNLIIVAILAFFIAKFYNKYGRSLSNRRSFSSNFILLALTVALIITIVRSSLALSLGLIGALSIVRFRAAIKEPEELAYLFFVISVGLGLGANQRTLTIIAVIFILLLTRLKIISDKKIEQYEQNLYLNINTAHPQVLKLENIKAILAKHCQMLRVKRIDNDNNILEACFLLEFKEKESFSLIEKELRQIDSAVKVTFLDNKGGSIAIP